MLGRLTFSLRRPDGGLVSHARDQHVLVAVYLNTDAAANWALRTGDIWVTDFQPGDVVIFSGVNTTSQKVNAYLNRPEGHRVIAPTTYVGNACEHDGIVIQRPYAEDPVTHSWIPDPEMQTELLGVLGQTIRAAVLNTSLQMSIGMIATCEPSARHEAVFNSVSPEI